ncbi:unnamed protein product [Urochloa decumbens]|uniref:Disease resistance protein At4g27190-like leucine-rich repeats domain-containing protein n=1 Tax=Urochloa decumbens TaxID=240449 RepID=A0ABC9DBA4_9POAL
MPRRELKYVYSVNQAIQQIIPFLEDTGRSAHKAIYFDGWDGLAASAVLRAIAEDPPPSLKKKFDKILHIDCSRWKSRRAFQRAIADKLELPQSVMTALDREDEEDDFGGVDEGSRAEVADATRETYQTIRNLSCLVIFHNGSDSTVDLSKFGFPQFEWFSPCTVLWTFRGRLRLNPEIKEKVDSSHMYIYKPISWSFDGDTAQLILDEATEIVKYIQHKQSISPEIAAECISYLLWLNKKGGGTMEYNWATHASSYWVCDGIIEGGQSDEAWEVSAALHQQIRLEECSSHGVNFPDHHQYKKHWKSVVYTTDDKEWTDITISPKLTTFFLAAKKGLPLPREMFQRSERLSVLRISECNFSFCSPPFRCCHNLRFLGLDNCKDQHQEEEDNQGKQVMGFFKSLWVLDVRNMDYELDLSQDITGQMAVNMREVHIKKGKIWRSNLSWRQLKNLCKLRVIEPTSSWDTGKEDEFMDMVKLELLDLSGNNTIQVLPSLCGATGLKTLVLDGCAGLEYVVPEGLPPSLESFSFDAGGGKDGNITAKVSRITLAGCAKLLDFRLLGSLPNLVELDLSGTAVKILDLKKVVQVQNLRRIFLIGCKQLRSIVWPANGMQLLRLLCIDTRQEVALFRETSRDSLVCQEQERCCHAHVWITDIRFLQSLGLTSGEQFCWISAPFKLNLYLSCTSKEDGKNCNKLEETVCPLLNRTGQVVRSPTLYNKSISMACRIYNDISIEERATENDGSSALHFEPQDLHIEMGQGITDINVVSTQGTKALSFMMNRVLSLHIHDSFITTTIPRQIVISTKEERISWRDLKWCHVERCPKLDTVFHTNYDDSFCFHKLETLQATGLLMARSIWSRARPYNFDDAISFAALRSIHLHLCPRLQYVLPLSFYSTFSSLETLYIVRCGDLRQVFPGEEFILSKIATQHRNGMLEFPRLKHLYLHDLSSLQQICKAKMFAPELKTVRIRGCWGVRHLPATDPHRRDGHRVDVDCEKDWWDNLEWDRLHIGHDPSLFKPRHSAYYKKRLLRTTVLR